MQTNPFPAILLAGPPHSGKSVLSYLLTEHLRQMHVPHYLLRAVPDGEGDWFLTGQSESVRLLRMRNKRGFSSTFVVHMRRAIESRPVPLLVDIGGKPQGDQFDLIAACTHSILLYHEQDDRAEWRGHLARAGLQPLAELRTELNATDHLLESRPVLEGVISGLQRETQQRHVGATFGALLDRVEGVFHFEEAELERIHLPEAPLPVLVERKLAAKVGLPTENKVFWYPENLSQLASQVTAGQPHALYGRGPVWLAAMLAAHALPADFALFDIRYGWLDVPPVETGGNPNLDVNYSSGPKGHWATFSLPAQAVLEPGPLSIAVPPSKDGLVVSGELPRWAFAALARFFAGSQPWVAVDDPAKERAVVVFSRTALQPIGSRLPRRQT